MLVDRDNLLGFLVDDRRFVGRSVDVREFSCFDTVCVDLESSHRVTVNEVESCPRVVEGGDRDFVDNY